MKREGMEEDIREESRVSRSLFGGGMSHSETERGQFSRLNYFAREIVQPATHQCWSMNTTGERKNSVPPILNGEYVVVVKLLEKG